MMNGCSQNKSQACLKVEIKWSSTWVLLVHKSWPKSLQTQKYGMRIDQMMRMPGLKLKPMLIDIIRQRMKKPEDQVIWLVHLLLWPWISQKKCSLLVMYSWESFIPYSIVIMIELDLLKQSQMTKLKHSARIENSYENYHSSVVMK